MTGLGYIAYTVTNPPCVVERTIVEIPDNEHGIINRTRGCTVRETDTGRYLGDCWSDGVRMCWRTTDCSSYGRASSLREAVRYIVSAKHP